MWTSFKYSSPTIRDDARTPLTESERRWQKEAIDLQHTSLERTRKTAESWGSTISALLGGFALVSFVKGPEALKDLPGQLQLLVLALVALAAVLVVLAIYLAAIAAQGVPAWEDDVTGDWLESNSEQATKDAIGKIGLSRGLTLVAVVLVLFGLFTVWGYEVLAPKADSPVSAFVSTGSAVVCGELVAAADGSIQVTPEGQAPVAVSPASTITLIDECPAP